MAAEPWKSVGDYVTLQRGKTYSGKLVGAPGPALLGLGSIEPGGGFRADKYKTFGGVCPPSLMVSPGDIYVALKGATKDGSMVGSVARLPSSVISGRLTQDTARLDFVERNLGAVNHLYWVLRTPHYRKYCAGRLTGSAAASFSRQDFLSYPVPPVTSTSRAIVSLLEAIETKIELNRRTNETLEAIARALFKSWFVDFDPVRAKSEGRDPGLPPHLADLFPDSLESSELGEIPSGWQLGILGDAARHQRRIVQPPEIEPSTPYIGLEHMPRRSISLAEWGRADALESAKFRFEKFEILFGKLRPYFHKVGVAPTNGVCSTDIVVLAPRTEEWFGFVLGTVASGTFVEYTNAGSTGTKMPRTSWLEMSRYPLVLPPNEVAAAFTNQVRLIVAQVVASIHQARTLANLRDTLLPKLMSGEVRVGHAEQLIVEVSR